MKYNYLEQCQQIIENNILSKEEIFDYSDSPFALLYENFFQFCQVNLSEEQQEYQLKNQFFIYYNHPTFNAFALKKNSFNVVAMNYTFPYHLYTDFNDFNVKIDEFVPQNLKKIFAAENLKPDYFITQFTLLFIYYHELGHILQKDGIVEITNELYEPVTEFNPINHLKEFDADLFAAQKVAIHVVEYWKHNVKDFNDYESLQLLLSIAVSGLINFIVHTFNLSTDFYLQENKHPHPIIRISYIIEFIAVVVQQLDPAIIKVDMQKIVNDAFAFILFQVSEREKINIFVEMFKKENDRIKEYSNVLLHQLKKNDAMVMFDKLN